jgi:hypothetical protein
MKANVAWTVLVAAVAAVVAGLLPDYAYASVTRVPEPSTLSILAAGVGAGALALRRARRKN